MDGRNCDPFSVSLTIQPRIMIFSKSFLLFSIACLCMARLQAQVDIPAYTGYAVPAEALDSNDESILFNSTQGLHNWSDTKQHIHYYFFAGKEGKIQVSLLVTNIIAGNTINVVFGGKNHLLHIPAGKAFKEIPAGEFNIPQRGFYSIEFIPVKKTGKTIASVQSIRLRGSIASDIHFNARERRNAASVHLKYPLPDTTHAVLFYNELTVPPGSDILHTYFMANGFQRGYFGMQVNSPTERRIIFSVWDAGNEAVDRAKVTDENKVQLWGNGEDVVAEGFGNEGTGGHSHWVYNWKAGETYKFVVTALPDSASSTTIYAGYFFVPEKQQWKLIASFRAPKDGNYLHGLYSFVENFDGVNGQLQRKALFGNQWIRTDNGRWKEITQSAFSYDATGKAGDRTDYGGGTEANQFYLWNGGFKETGAKYGDVFNRNPNMSSPVVDVARNADSIAQAAKDRQMIFSAIAAGKLDTTGSVSGVYYKILREGTGATVSVTDTVTAFYKGALMNGDVFDQTKEKPAVFPLARLIKGWQLGVPMCREGGKIQLIIPSGLAYSIRTRSGKIPPNSILLFDIEVVSTKK